MFGQEGGQSLPIVRPVLLRLTQPVYEDDGDLGGDLPLLVEDPQWLQNPGQESLARVGAAVVDVEAGEEVWLGLEEVVVAPQLGRLAQLPGQRLEELRHQAGGGVVRLAEVVGDEVGCKPGEVAGGQTLVLDPPALAKATCLDQRENDSSLASAWAYDTV